MADSSSVVEIQAVPASDAKAPPTPVLTFDSFPVMDEIKAGVRALGYVTPTDVQAAVITPAVQGRDIVVQAKTGSGKTCAFGVPLLDRVARTPAKPHEPHGLVLAPTRELAHQVSEELRAIGQPRGLKVHAIYGGVPMGKQISALKTGVDVVSGTPGRILDHLRRKNMSFDSLEVIVLDEADEMLSMGFWDEVTDILKLCPAGRQTMLFSATLPYEVAKAAAQFLRDPVRVDVSQDHLTVEGIDNIIIHTASDMPKPRQLMYVLEDIRPDSAIIFCNTRNETELMAKFLTQSGFVAEPLSGNMRQKDRERVMARIKSGELRYMVATDIAARGIDINDLSHVINYSLPEFTEVYVHRVGRTGRIGKLGTAVSLVDGVGLATLSRLEREFGIKFIEKPLPPEEEASRKRSERIMKELSEKAAVSEVGAHMPVAAQILSSTDNTQIVAYLLKQYYSQVANEGERRARDEAPPPRHAPAHRADNGDAPAAAAAGGAAAEGEGEAGRRRRRRRRGRRGERGSERGPERGGDRGGDRGGERRDARSDRPLGDGFETMDAHEALGGLPPPVARAPAPSPALAPEVAAAPAIVPVEAPASAPVAPVAVVPEVVDDGFRRLKVNIGFDDGFKGRGAVAKRVAALAGLTEGSVLEVESRREYSVLKALPDIAELVVDRVDGTPIGKKILTVQIA